ncbi:hypothetical protein ASV05_17445 [Enterobacter hormaechei subsp. xiangfangensis]|nr:hypothetical protein ASV05_17445 [Enterobacter hormaechei subsp. xiangfangensis]OZP61891.1 hypothetical protein CIG26_16310 [Enterobacter hormaechei]
MVCHSKSLFSENSGKIVNIILNQHWHRLPEFLHCNSVVVSTDHALIGLIRNKTGQLAGFFMPWAGKPNGCTNGNKITRYPRWN